MKWLGIAAAATVIICCFFPWATVESRNIVISGMESSGTNYGKPGLLHIIFSSVYLLLAFIGRTWSQRINLFFCAFNLAWAIRNLLLIPACHGGECPVKHAALYIIMIGSVLMLLGVMFAPLKQKASSPDL